MTVHRGHHTRALGRMLALMAMAFVVAIGGATAPAQAADAGKVSRVSYESAYSTLTLTFDAPVPPAVADEARRALTPEAVTPMANSQYSWNLGCGHSVSFFDGNGRFDAQYYCGSTRTIPWGFRLSATNQATVVGTVSEAGLRWWRNGASMPQNAPHNVPPSYQFHGTMSPVYAGNNIDFQDYLTWRHNIGPGGTAALTIAGSLHLTN